MGLAYRYDLKIVTELGFGLEPIRQDSHYI